MTPTAKAIVDYFIAYEASRSRPFIDRFKDPISKKEIDNAVLIPVPLLRALVEESRQP